jgi:hypothetical protein
MLLYEATGQTDQNWNVIIGFIATVIGALGAIVGGAFGSWFSRQQERQALAAALAAEVHGLMDIVEVKHIVRDLEQGVVFDIGDNPLAVFYATVSKVGFLPPPLVSRVVEFYSEAAEVVVDLRTIRKGDFPDELSKETFRRGLVNRILALVPRGKALEAELREEASRTWHHYLYG